MTDTTIIIIRETMLEGIVNDLSMASVFIILIGFGIYWQSSAMQWAGLCLAAFFVLGWASHHSRDRVMTISEARQKLDAIEQRGIQ